jgi:hypothetical protein
LRAFGVLGVWCGNVQRVQSGAIRDILVSAERVLRAEFRCESLRPFRRSGGDGMQAGVGEALQVFGKFARYFTKPDDAPIYDGFFHAVKTGYDGNVKK